MVTDESAIRHVTDTAYWTAAIRAKETLRSDALFRDVLAGVLCGERGRKIAQAMPRPRLVEWGTVLRTAAIDRLIHQALALDAGAMINMGAGLDTRPYRMTLPALLRWIEMDFPSILEYKNAVLGDRTSVCGLQRFGIDLLDLSERRKAVSRCSDFAKRAVVITEGVIPYLPNEDVASLAEELHASPSVGYWIQDFDNAGPRPLPRGWQDRLRAAPFRFQVRDWFGFFEQRGWKPRIIITSAGEAERVNRPYPYDFPYGLLMRALPREMRQKIKSLSGAVLMQKI